jgi:hypothetical protein
MIDLEMLVHKLRKELRENYQNIGDAMIAGNVKTMENYQFMLGQARAYQSIDAALTNMLNPKEVKKNEPRKDNVVSITGFELDGDTKN